MGRIAAVLSLALVVGASIRPAFAHHSAAVYDFDRRWEIAGVVKAIRVMNPHVTLTLLVAGRQGTRTVEFEGHSVNNFYRVGWRPHMIEPGDRIEVIFAPRKDHLAGGYVTGFVTAHGRVIRFTMPGVSGIKPVPAEFARSS